MCCYYYLIFWDAISGGWSTLNVILLRNCDKTAFRLKENNENKSFSQGEHTSSRLPFDVDKNPPSHAIHFFTSHSKEAKECNSKPAHGGWAKGPLVMITWSNLNKFTTVMTGKHMSTNISYYLTHCDVMGQWKLTKPYRFLPKAIRQKKFYQNIQQIWHKNNISTHAVLGNFCFRWLDHWCHGKKVFVTAVHCRLILESRWELSI